MLLLALPPEVFEAIVPWLILFTCLLVGVSPRSTAGSVSGVAPTSCRATRPRPVTTFFAAVTGVYGGYFGAGSGVMMMAVLGLGTDLEFRIVNALKTLAVVAVERRGHGHLPVRRRARLAGHRAAGRRLRRRGYVGARVGRRLPPTLLRTAVVITGVVAAGLMLF